MLIIEIIEHTVSSTLAHTPLSNDEQTADEKLKKKNHSKSSIMLGKTVTATAIIPKTPKTLFINENDPSTALRASPITPPIIGITLPEAALTHFIARLSAEVARLPFMFISPTKTVAATDNATVIVFLTADVILERSSLPFKEE